MTSLNGNIFRVTGHLCGEFTGPRPVTRSFDVFFDLRLNKRWSKQLWGWWFEMVSRPLWRHRNVKCNRLIIHNTEARSANFLNYTITLTPNFVISILCGILRQGVLPLMELSPKFDHLCMVIRNTKYERGAIWAQSQRFKDRQWKNMKRNSSFYLPTLVSMLYLLEQGRCCFQTRENVWKILSQI